MSIELLINLVIFAVAGLFTPGPNNAMLASSGANFGFRASMQHFTGVTLGFATMALIVGLSLGEVYERSDFLREFLRYAGAALLLWVAWQIATSGTVKLGRGRPRPLRFWEAAGFQWINPKAWAMAIGITSAFILPSQPILSAFTVFTVFVIFGFMSSMSWTAAGQAMLRYLTNRTRRITFNLVNAGLILMGVIGILLGPH